MIIMVPVRPILMSAPPHAPPPSWPMQSAQDRRQGCWTCPTTSCARSRPSSTTFPTYVARSLTGRVGGMRCPIRAKTVSHLQHPLDPLLPRNHQQLYKTLPQLSSLAPVETRRWRSPRSMWPSMPASPPALGVPRWKQHCCSAPDHPLNTLQGPTPIRPKKGWPHRLEIGDFDSRELKVKSIACWVEAQQPV